MIWCCYTYTQVHKILGTGNNLGDPLQWYDAYNEGNDNIRDFIFNNLPEDKKLLITSNITEDDARRLPLPDVIKFLGTKFDGNSFGILCDSVKKSNQVSTIWDVFR